MYSPAAQSHLLRFTFDIFVKEMKSRGFFGTMGRHLHLRSRTYQCSIHAAPASLLTLKIRLAFCPREVALLEQ
jgi:hypothetical protein